MVFEAGDCPTTVDAALDSYRLWALNGQAGLPDRDGVTLESSFVGPGQRRSPRLSYVPSRLSMVRTCAPRECIRRTTGSYLLRRVAS